MGTPRATNLRSSLKSAVQTINVLVGREDVHAANCLSFCESAFNAPRNAVIVARPALVRVWFRLRRAKSYPVHFRLEFHPTNAPSSVSASYDACMNDSPRRASHPADPPASTTSADDVPERIGPYRIIRELGAGGMATVYLGEDDAGQRFAIKRPEQVPAGDDAFIKRFYREARSARGVQHPHLCPVHDVGQDGDQYFLAMAWIEGETLAHALASGTTFTAARALDLIRILAEAMHAAHLAGIVHRDLKPANIMLRPDGQPVIIDFGLARRFDNTETLLTLTGAIGGTPGYMAPEQITGAADDIGPPCDIYALGVVLYELLTGATPFSGNVATILGSIVSEPPPRLSLRCPGIEPVLDALCLRALAKSPADRYATAQEFADCIAAYLADGPDAVAERLAPLPAAESPPEVPVSPPAQPGALRRMFGKLFGRPVG